MSSEGSTNLRLNIPDELIDRIADRVVEKVRPLIVAAARREDETILDVKGLAAYLSVTEQWVRDKARAGEIPCFKTGKCWKFYKRQIDKKFPATVLSLESTAAPGRGH